MSAGRVQALRSVTDAPLVLTAIAVLTAKLVWFAIDHAPLFYMGDSRAYIGSAIWGLVLTDRSNTYGLLLRLVAVIPGTLTTLVVAQTLAGAMTAWLLAFLLLRYFKVHAVVAVSAAVLFALEPLQILHERLVLTESFAVFLLALYLLVSLSYLARPGAATLLAIAATGVVLLSLRLVYIPVTLIGAALIPCLAWAGSKRVRPFVAHLSLSVLATFGLHQVYKSVTGSMAKRPPAYQYADGFFLAASWAHLIEPADATDPRARRVIEKQLGSDLYPLRNAGLRSAQLWMEGGLKSELVNAFDGDAYSANLAAKQVSMRTLRRVPLSVVRSGALTYTRFWHGPGQRLDRGLLKQGSPSPDPRFLVTLKKWFNLDAAETWATMTPSIRYYLAGAPWYRILSVSPLIVLLGALLCRTEARPGAIWICVSTALLLAIPCIAVIVQGMRALHPLAFGTVAALAVISDGVFRRLTHA